MAWSDLIRLWEKDRTWSWVDWSWSTMAAALNWDWTFEVALLWLHSIYHIDQVIRLTVTAHHCCSSWSFVAWKTWCFDRGTLLAKSRGAMFHSRTCLISQSYWASSLPDRKPVLGTVSGFCWSWSCIRRCAQADCCLSSRETLVSILHLVSMLDSAHHCEALFESRFILFLHRFIPTCLVVLALMIQSLMHLAKLHCSTIGLLAH